MWLDDRLEERIGARENAKCRRFERWFPVGFEAALGGYRAIYLLIVFWKSTGTNLEQICRIKIL